MVKRVTSYGAVEVWSEPMGSFIMNGQRLKHYTTRDVIDQDMSLVLKEPL